MTEQKRKWVDRINRFFLFQAALFQFLWGPMAGAYATYHLCKLLGFFGKSALFWAVMSPVVYLFWIVVLLLFYVAETMVIGWFWEKPRHLRQKRPGHYSGGFIVCQILYNRFYAVYSLPLIKTLLNAPIFGTLILRSYSFKTSLGKEPFIGGLLWDPDLTIIGDGVILGGDCRVVGHSMVRDENGLMVYQTAPVEFCENCIIGGDSRVEMGVKVGARAIVQSRSHVQPFTIIPPDEVWGGDPAVFQSKRNYVTAVKAVTSPARAAMPADGEICGLIALALSLPVEKITRETSSDNCELWDSMGKMAIAAGLHDRLGIVLEPEEMFALNSVVLVEEIVATKRGKTAPGSSSASVAINTEMNPDFLPLMEPSAATAMLAAKYQNDSTDTGKKTRVVVAATFVAQPLGSALQLWARACGCPVELEFYDFNQVPQALLSPESLLRKNREGLNVVLARPEDFPEGKEKEAAEGLLSAINAFVESSGNALLVGDLPPVVSAARKSSPALDALRTWWLEELRGIDGVQVVDFGRIIEEIGKTAAQDAQMELEASAPYSAAVYQRLGIGIARAVRQLQMPAKKVLALDADNTLWSGVIGEDGMEGIDVRGFKAFQASILALKERGILLVMVSKNAPGDVAQVLDEHLDMILRRKDFSALRVNWKPKSENLKELAAELNVGLDSFVLFDDSEAERLEVKANCPGVTVVPFEKNPVAQTETLERLWLFDGAGETNEDAKRHDFTAQENKRKESESFAASLESYLVSLELKVAMRKARVEDLPRVQQLVQKTNQFNLSLKRRSLPEIKALQPQHDIWVLSATDRFGDYGMVGCCISLLEKDVLILDTLLLSCRALGRGIEEAFLHGLAQQAAAQGAARLRAPFVKGPRNQPVELFLEKFGFNQLNEIPVGAIPTLPKHLSFELTS